MNNNKSAFPLFEEARVNENGAPCTDYVLTEPGMTPKEYAAIHLKVPRSGNPEIDGMIRESVRRDFAEKALVGNVLGENVHDKAALAASYYGLANAMLAEWEKEAGK